MRVKHVIDKNEKSVILPDEGALTRLKVRR